MAETPGEGRVMQGCVYSRSSLLARKTNFRFRCLEET